MIPTSTRLSYANGYIELGMLEHASDELDAIAENARLLPEVLAMRARYYLETQNWELMEAVSKTLAESQPNSYLGWIHWAYALREQDRTQDAKAVALTGLTRHPKVGTLWFNLACYCSLLGELDDADKHLAKAIELEKAFEAEAMEDPDLENLRKRSLPGNS